MKNYIQAESVIGRRITLIYEQLYKKIKPELHASCYNTLHESYNADAEFAGKYIDIALWFYTNWDDEDSFKAATEVAKSAICHQRGDGYLGTYYEGKEFSGFSVWNQAFTCIGLLAYYSKSGDAAALTAVEKCIDYNAGNFMSQKADLLRSGNQGSQHLVLLIAIMLLYRISKKEQYLNFARFILDTCQKNPCFDVLNNSTALGLASQKGLEMLLFMLGVLEYAEQADDDRYLCAVQNYWESVKKDQIIPTGCGTVSEAWRPHGNKPAMLPVEINPNENCVAVAWMELSAKLYSITKNGKYFDAFEKTLYNHLFGSMAPDGSDFAYYQGTYGAKIIATRPTSYSCCRYRGLAMCAYLPEMTVMQFEDSVYMPLYTEFSRTIQIAGVLVKIKMETNYPMDGKVCIHLRSEKPVTTKVSLRIPEWCRSYKLFEGNQELEIELENGHLTWNITITDNDNVYNLLLTMPINVEKTEICSQKVASYTYGPVLLATDTFFGETLYSTTIDENAVIRKSQEETQHNEIVRFEVSGTIRGIPKNIHLIDYASAGMKRPGKDLFRIWIPMTENEMTSGLW